MVCIDCGEESPNLEPYHQFNVVEQSWHSLSIPRCPVKAVDFPLGTLMSGKQPLTTLSN